MSDVNKDMEIKAFKGFDKDLKCRDFQYKVGETYTHSGDVKACNSGFHACEYPLDIFGYYPPTSRFCEVTLAGDISTDSDDSKIASAKITIDAEISLPTIISKSIEWILSKVDSSDSASNTGDYSAVSNTGYQSAASNTGYQSAASNTGNQSAASNTGDYSAASNTGYQSAASNTGYRSAASVSGRNSVAMATGFKSKAMASEGCAVVLCFRGDSGELIHIKAGIAGKDVNADTWYSLNSEGEFVEVKA